VLAALGDLVEDIVVRLDGPASAAIATATDTAAVIERRRGGSAANVAAVAARLAGEARLLGQVGDDPIGGGLLAQLSDEGVDVDAVRRRGRTGSIVVLVDSDGERSFLTDPGASRQLADPDERWLDDIDVLHVPLYSLTGGPIAETAETLIRWAHWRSIGVSIDASSLAVIAEIGVAEVHRTIERLAPDVVFANADEAAALKVDAPLGRAITYVKRGAGAATVFVPGMTATDVPAERLGGAIDSTGAGDAFAAGVLTTPTWRSDPVSACAAGHRAASALLRARPAAHPAD
jgi:sugar/nucleoside kinase (ribokinase family)